MKKAKAFAIQDSLFNIRYFFAHFLFPQAIFAPS